MHRARVMRITMASTLATLQDWVNSTAELTRPDAIQWCDGSADEYQRLVDEYQRR